MMTDNSVHKICKHLIKTEAYHGYIVTKLRELWNKLLTFRLSVLGIKNSIIFPLLSNIKTTLKNNLIESHPEDSIFII